MNKYTNSFHERSHALADSLILEHYSLSELNFETVGHYRERFARVKPGHPWNGLETKEFLYKIGAWGKLRDSSKEGLTLAGLLMFSEERIITEVLPQYFLEYREHVDGEAAGWTKRFTSQDGTWSGNIYDFYFRVLAELERHVWPDEGRALLGEALANAIVHADYGEEGGITVEKEDRSFRFANPGRFRIPIEAAMAGHTSNLRNPNIFKMFLLIDVCKRAGSGLKRMCDMQEQALACPIDISQQTNPDRTIVVLCPLPFPAEMSPTMETEPAGQLEQLEPEWMDPGSGQETESFITNELSFVSIDTNSVNNEENSVNITKNSVNSGSNSIKNEPNSVNRTSNSINKELEFVNSLLSSVNNDIRMHDSNEKGETIDERLWKMAELARRKKRLAPAVMEQLIVRLCRERPLRLKELAELLERTPDGLRNNYLGKLLEEGKIRLKYPDQPNHPRQAYIAVDE
ncbi:transcriptional regulator [Geobacillus thermocatenulatus]|uniref:Transcriptional regulator n=1 Tax=Geobacillus thermocatenulatus TaxID=33938 RepID=A0A226Q8A0_9BACL|nr:ATP-binding protein [Geobacillus thermocatenulatus]ASS97872.1 transcriptional regulator [Geobacillus thermocatenulatus]OXB88616.1 transcriptional regulator [Geobacillus thermocatenulatus]RAN31196.1 transcriptional regulator [Geobacillus sp. A8]